MSDITGSQSLGYGFSLAYDVNPSTSNPTATVYLEWEGQKLGSATLNSSSASASIGGSAGGYKAKGTITANWSAKNITYSVQIKGLGVNKTYSGTLVKWT